MGSARPRAAAALTAVVIIILISSAKSQEEGACLYETGTALNLCGKYVFTGTGPVSNECCTYLRDLINDSISYNLDDKCDSCVSLVGIYLSGENESNVEILNNECGVNITPDPVSCEGSFHRHPPTEVDCNYPESVIKSCNDSLTAVKEEGPVSNDCCAALRDFNVAVSTGNTNTSTAVCRCFNTLLLIEFGILPGGLGYSEDFRECGVNVETLCH